MSRTIESAGVHLPIEEMYLSFLTYKLRNEFGFMESAKTNTPKNDKGEIIPLYTYPCYEWINSIDWSGANVFEYGCGYSSYFWNEKNVNLWGVDCKEEWVVHDNIIIEKDLNKYPDVINETNKKFDVIVIDGVVRYDCVGPSLKKVKSNGMIILDNSDWHKDTKELLDKENFIPIHFHGFKPIHVDSETTSCYLGKDFNRKAKSIIPMGGTYRKQHETDKPYGVK